MALLSAPSYVIPGTYLENIRFLNDKSLIDGVELLFFTIDTETVLLLKEEMAGITYFRERFSYSVHLPDILEDDYRSLIGMLRPIADKFIVHAPATNVSEFTGTLEKWTREFGDVFLLENVAGREFDDIANSLSNTRLCCDTGHMLLEGNNPIAVLNRWNERIEEVHFHGVFDGKDHAMVTGHECWFRDITPFLESFHGRLHIEVFDFRNLSPMIDLVAEYRHQNEKSQLQELNNE